jgi:hypothetical protein
MAGTIVADTLQNGAGTSTSMDNAINGSAKAWVSYNGNTQAIRASYNVSSVTFRANGRYTVNFTNALADGNYSIVGMVSNDSTATSFIGAIQDTTNAAPSTTACPVMTGYATGSGMVDSALYRATNYAYFAFFR